MEPYQYSPHYNCRHVSALPYDALSYHWGVGGDEKPDRPINVSTPTGSRRLFIYEPLETAILELAAAGFTQRAIFIDQICIDQRSPADKACQVPLMGEIYTRSTRVVVRLGPSTPASDDYFRFVRQINAASPLGRIANPEFPLASAIDVQSRSWFSRLWVIQEFCLVRDAVLLCGGEVVCVTCLRAAMLFFVVHNVWWLRNIKGDVPVSTIKQRERVFQLNAAVIRLFQERRAIHTGDGKRDLYDVVLKYNIDKEGNKIGATMPEDRIFGLMGLARDDAYWRQVRPVFSAGGPGGSTPRVDPTSGCLVVEGVIVDHISRVGARQLQLDPSDKTSEGVDYIMTKAFLDETQEFVETAAQLATSSIHGLHADQLAQVAIRLSDFGLTEKVLLEDMAPDAVATTLVRVREQVHQTGQMLIKANNAIQTYTLGNLLQSLSQAPWYWAPPNEFEMVRSCAATPRQAVSTLLRGARLAAMDVLVALGASTAMFVVTRWIAFRKRFRGFNFEGVTSSQRAGLQRFGLDETLLRSTAMRDYRDHLARNIGNRVYMTKQGFVGLCPSQAVVGDAVAVVLGGTVPHILRAKAGAAAGRWEYVGEAYCEGVMQGEAVRQPDQRVGEILLE
ncbi:conserved hypothetical protein [Verticillium alfalfae VaMs.102]|uniref:Heterokaryon incompatibility domain-containing protein n=1 Tax=Verticillium alfalfae (strain VaMs.102 / ATCC MYA-4576 / FGSC 10136) TaxID=526221 RepID=C9SRG6_VERA1|nr:conserved hypothetical protein [Verticillium alfalfae VaMs.102]EEY21381.1 conserved hypothetical protein [Verticillium alfalfae VaMs.102]